MDQHPDYRPNPKRAVYVHGTIDQGLLDKLTPRILVLLAESRAPITVYIDSRGGIPFYVDSVLRLLRSPDQDGSPPCRVITVVTSRAASAAADMLSAGDYAIAYPETTILYHGVRTPVGSPVTAEYAAYLTESMKLDNDRFAMALATKSHMRFAFRYVALKSGFEDYRTQEHSPDLGDFESFLGLVREKMSPLGLKVITRARERYDRYDRVFESVLRRAARRATFKNPKRQAEMESAILHGIVDYELHANREADWSYTSGGLAQVTDDFLLMREYLSNYESQQLKSICDSYGKFILTKEQEEGLSQLPKEDQEKERRATVKVEMRPIWVFFVALCHALQEIEDWILTATDAFWLGLIDEVVGEDLPTVRVTVESQPKQLAHPGMLANLASNESNNPPKEEESVAP